ncbi:MAG TPA: hypothetical protein VGX48_16170 [Pyrinomonadaceae bacterium]|jgi:hypothetical protein|nr:hypothetical protein [Pyrinomonadaceae bacterium]
MKQRPYTPTPLRALAGAVAAFAALCLMALPAAAQSTAGGTQIQNRASATYSDGTNNYSVVSNTVTVTVANVSGLAITPDAGSVPTVVSGQTSVDFTFTVTNTGNYPTQVRFLASGASVQLSGPATVTAAVIDLTNNGLGAGDTDILGNASDVLSASVARNASITVVVRASVNAAASAGATISVRLGDAASGGPTFDNQTANTSAAEVRTSVPTGTTAPVNGESEARGDISTTVQNDAQLRLNLTAPAGPVALGSNITYTWSLDNTGARPAAAQTLTNAPAGSNSGVFVIAPVPARTTFVSAAPPAGVTVLYSTSPMTSDPLTGATWTTSPPAVAGNTVRVAYLVGATLAAGGSVTNMGMTVSVNTGINASLPLYEIGDVFAKNSIGTNLTDQSGDAVVNKGDGNANFNEPRFGVDALSATQGFQLPTLLTQTGAVLLGPSGAPSAVGPTDNNDDYTNKSVAPAAIAGLSHLDTLTGAVSVDFVNTVQNTGNADDTFTLSAPTVPAGFTVQISTDGGTTFVPASSNPTVAVAFGATANFTVRVTTTANAAVLQGFSTVIRATSGLTSSQSNDTINRVYTGFLRLVKTYQVINATGVGAATDAVPGADIVYTITYTNVSAGGGGAGCVNLTASSVVITENGSASPNNWGSTTTQVLSPAPADSTTGAITDGDTNGAVTATTTHLKDSIPSVAPGASGTFTFRRKIN